jgi:hypothetical protein
MGNRLIGRGSIAGIFVVEKKQIPSTPEFPNARMTCLQ